jgi:hypothetical protein
MAKARVAAAMRTHVIARPRVLAWMRRTFAAAFVARLLVDFEPQA